MPLRWGKIGGHDSERLAFTFTMLDRDQTVECQISDAAMDELAGTRGTPSMARQGQFVSLATKSRRSHPTCSMPARS
jgi:hypothetical protein